MKKEMESLKKLRNYLIKICSEKGIKIVPSDVSEDTTGKEHYNSFIFMHNGEDITNLITG